MTIMMADEQQQKKQEKQVKVTASRAKGQFGLDEGDLAQLDCQLVPNPHYRSAPPMRLYALADVQEASRAKQAHNKAWEAGREGRLREARANAKAAAKARASAAAERFSTLRPADPPADGSTALPVHVWAEVLSTLMRDAWDPCVAAKTVCVAAAVCRDLRLASVEVLRHAMADDDPEGNARLSRAVSDPSGMKKEELKRACADLGIPVGGNKPELAVRVLGALGLDRLRGKDAPVALLVEAGRQRATCWREDRGLAFLRPLSTSSGRRVRSLGLERSDSSAWEVRRALHAEFGAERIGRLSAFECICDDCPGRGSDSTFGPSATSGGFCSHLMCEGCCARACARTDEHEQCAKHRRMTLQRGCIRCCKNVASSACSATMCGACCSAPTCERHARHARHARHMRR